MGLSVKSFSLFFLFFSIVFFSCQKNTAQRAATIDSFPLIVKEVFTDHIIDTAALGLRFIPSGDYNQIKQKIINKRDSLKSSYINAPTNEEKKVVLDRARQIFTDGLLNEIFPHWYGTTWDFDGYSNIPNQGEIACGYFISTTLKHMGLNMNRYRFAQQAGLNGAKTFSPENDFTVFFLNSTEELDTVITKIENEYDSGLYTVGLSNHVGFIYIKDKTAYFIHSNYIDGYVMAEKARYSDAFRSMVVVITDLTHNDFFIESWVLNKEIRVITD